MHPNASQLKHQAQLLTRQGRYHEAASLYTRYLAEHPQDAHAMALLAITLLNMQRPQACRKTAERAVGTDPEEPLAHFALAMGVLADLSRMSPQFVPWLPSTWQHKQSKQTENKPLKSPRLREAELHLLEALRLAPHEAFFHAQLAAIRLDDGPNPGVQEAIDSGLAQDPEDGLCHEYQTRLYLAQQDHTAALAAARRLLELEPNNKTAHALTARCLLEQAHGSNTDTFTATEHARNAARLDPTDDEARDVLLECFHRQHAVYRIPIRIAQKVHRFRSRWPGRDHLPGGHRHAPAKTRCHRPAVPRPTNTPGDHQAIRRRIITARLSHALRRHRRKHLGHRNLYRQHTSCAGSIALIQCGLFRAGARGALLRGPGQRPQADADGITHAHRRLGWVFGHSPAAQVAAGPSFIHSARVPLDRHGRLGGQP